MNKSSFTLFILILIIVLATRFFLFYRSQPHYTDGQSLSFETKLLSEPQNFSKYQKLSANLASGEKIFITTSILPQFHYADSVRISGALKTKVLSNKRVVMTMFFPKIEAVEKDKKGLSFFGKNILAVASFIRQKIVVLFEKTLSPASSGLLLGIVFGIKEGMPSEFAGNLKTAGVLHVVAASGMNVTIVGGFLSSFFVLFLRRQLAIIASIFGILFYAFLAGMEPSILRATLMGILVFSAQILGRQTLAWYGLFLAGFLMLFFSPNLLFDVGFQLSFAATAGLIFIPKMRKIERIKVVGESINTTLAAQLATLPILLANFGTYSLWSIVVNSLVLWTVPMLMIIGGVAAMVGLAFSPLGQLILYLSLPLLLYFEKVVEIFADLGGMVKIHDFPWQMAAGYYGVLVGIILFLEKRGRALRSVRQNQAKI